MPYQTIDVRPLAGACGAEVFGADVSKPLDNAQGDEILDDLTEHVVWTSGDPGVASFAGSDLVAHQEGYVAVRASLPGMSVETERAPLAVVTTSNEPIILYAGWSNTRLIEGESSTVRVEARLAGTVKWVWIDSNPHVNGLLRDDGQNGDTFAGDGIYTLTGPSDASIPSGDSYVEIYAIPTNAYNVNLPPWAQATTWPYFTIGNPALGPATTQGHPSNPFVSESDAFGPRLRGVGFGPCSVLPAGTGGTVTMFARELNKIDEITAYYGGGASPAIFTDDGTGADQIAGDGLWTAEVVLPPVLPEGLHVIDFVPAVEFNTGTQGGAPPPLNEGDAYPRLRVHFPD